MIKGIVKIFIGTLFFLSIASCEKRSCKDVVCKNSIEICNNGVCLCPNGLEGTGCNTASSDKYVGNYFVSESCPYAVGGAPFGNYNAYITADPFYISRITIGNVLNQGPLDAEIRTDGSNKGNTIAIPQQNLGAITISGQGVYDEYNRRINIDFTYTYNFVNYQCTHTFYKQ